MKALLFASVPVLLIAAAFAPKTTTTTSVSRAAANPQVEAMKACARKAKVARARWFFEETGITTTPDSGAAQAYSNRLKAVGIAPKRPIPAPVC